MDKPSFIKGLSLGMVGGLLTYALLSKIKKHKKQEEKPTIAAPEKLIDFDCN